MRSENKKSALVKLGLSLWALATLILCFVAVLLFNELVRNGANPLAPLSPARETGTVSGNTAPEGNPKAGSKEISLFFALPDGTALAAEPAAIEPGAATVENCRRALEALIAGPRRGGLSPVLPAGTKMRGLYLMDSGQLIVDLSGELALAFNAVKSASAESLMVQAVANTVAQESLCGPDAARVAQVRFLVEGAAPQEGFPAHIDLTMPVVPDQRWVRTAGG